MKSILVLSVAALVAIGTVRAELVYFARGGKVQITATVEGDMVRLDTPAGPKVFPRRDFLRIVPGHRPDDEWRERCAQADRSARPEATFELAWWGIENGLTSEAIELLGRRRAIAEDHGPTRRMLGRLDALAAPCPMPDLTALRAKLGSGRFREATGEHVVLLHQGDDAEARERLDVLERVVRSFYLTLAARGIELPGPRRKLASVYFAERRDYVRFLRSADAPAFANTHGYYHPALRVVFAFDTRSGEAQRAGHRAIANRKKDGVGASELDRQALFLDLEWRAVDLGTAAHETIHQLTIDSGLAPRFDDFPTWLHEGFAAQFEVVRGGRWAGVGRAHDLRLPDWRAIHPAPKLLPLLDDDGLGRGYNRDRYAESWALVYFLRKAHPREFIAYLDLLRTPTPGTAERPGRAVDAFRAAFGDDLGKLEIEWRKFLAETRTPLEEADRP